MKKANIVPIVAESDNASKKFLTPSDLFALLICSLFVLFCAWYQTQGNIATAVFTTYTDFSTYLQAGNGDLLVHYYAYWILPLFQLMAALPPVVSYFIWNILNLAGVFFAAKVFGGKPAFALLTYQMFYTIFYGNIIGILIGCLGLLWWSMKNHRWHLAGIGLILACTKYQLGVTMGFFIWLLAPVTWPQRLRVLPVPFLVLLVSLIIYPLWPIESITTILQTPPDDLSSISLWQWLGPIVLLLWIPPVILPLERMSRLIALATTTTLVMPYFQQTDLLALFVLPIGWLPLLGNLGFYLFAQYDHAGLKVLVVIPVLVYLWIILPSAKSFIWQYSHKETSTH